MLDDESRLDLPAVPAHLVGQGVAAWREPVTIDTYLPDPADRYPAFLENRVYQGSSGRVYPLPFHERISPTKAPHAWDAIHLENPWIRLMILPELGGRIHVGMDTTNGYDFFYRNNVIKPALVGLAGPVDLRRRRVQLAAAPPPRDVPAGRGDDRARGRRRRHGVVLGPRPVRPDEGHARHPPAAGLAR